MQYVFGSNGFPADTRFGKGDIFDRLLALVDLDLAYLPFARNLQTLAREFRLADLRKALGDF